MTTQSATVRSREIRLASRPAGEPTAANFTSASVDIGPPGDGELLVRNTMMSVEPYMRGRMNDVKSYVPPFALGEPLTGAAVGTVLASRVPEIPEGATVLHDRGWREHAIVPAKSARAIDTSRVPAETYLGALGTTGFTAWVGLRIIADVQAGETIFVSAAAGAVGSMAVQLAKRWGLHVIGSASSAEKARVVRDEFGADAAFDYHAGAHAQLAELAPGGVDVYFDNVGGWITDAVIPLVNRRARIVICGTISQYSGGLDAPELGPRFLHHMLYQRATIQGMLARDYLHRMDEMIRIVGPWVQRGEIVFEETVVKGFERLPATLNRLFTGDHRGKLLVEVD